MKLLAAVIAALCLVPAVAHADVPEDADWTEAYIETQGEPTLHVDILKPEGDAGGRQDCRRSCPSARTSATAARRCPARRRPARDRPSSRWSDLIEGGKVFEKRLRAGVGRPARLRRARRAATTSAGTGEQARRQARRRVGDAASRGRPARSACTASPTTAGPRSWRSTPSRRASPPRSSSRRSSTATGRSTRTASTTTSGWYNTPALYQAIDAGPPSIFDSPQYIAGAAAGHQPRLLRAEHRAAERDARDRRLQFWDDARAAERGARLRRPDAVVARLHRREHEARQLPARVHDAHRARSACGPASTTTSAATRPS